MNMLSSSSRPAFNRHDSRPVLENDIETVASRLDVFISGGLMMSMNSLQSPVRLVNDEHEGKHNEEAFEKETSFTVRGLVRRGNSKYDSTLCLYPEALIQFIQTTQLETWEALKKALGGDARSTFLSHVAKEITLRGTLAGFETTWTTVADSGWCFHRAETRSWRRFKQNVLTVVRQVKYSTTTQNSIDLVLIPVFTSELKNELTGQDVINAVRQYRFDRRPEGEPRSNSDDAWPTLPSTPIRIQVTTRLCKSSYFIPFNRGSRKSLLRPSAVDMRPITFGSKFGRRSPCWIFFNILHGR